MNADTTKPRSGDARLRQVIDGLYHGGGRHSAAFRWGLLTFDLVCLLYFVAASFAHDVDEMHAVEVVIGVIYLIDYGARWSISQSRVRFLLHPIALADLIVVVSLLAPALGGNFVFLRVMRAMRLLRSYHVIMSLRERSQFVRLHEDIIFGVVNLLVFIFVMTAVVYVLQVHSNAAIENYVDALYFTVTTLTTTGFGDITLVGTSGRVLAVLIMIFGISLFLRLIQTIFRPEKVRFECGGCGLTRHDNDSVHCKHCGALLHIQTEGSS